MTLYLNEIACRYGTSPPKYLYQNNTYYNRILGNMSSKSNVKEELWEKYLKIKLDS